MARKKRRKKTRKHKSGGGNGHPTGLGDGDQRKIDEYLADENIAEFAAQDPRDLDDAARIDAVYAVQDLVQAASGGGGAPTEGTLDAARAVLAALVPSQWVQQQLLAWIADHTDEDGNVIAARVQQQHGPVHPDLVAPLPDPDCEVCTDFDLCPRCRAAGPPLPEAVPVDEVPVAVEAHEAVQRAVGAAGPDVMPVAPRAEGGRRRRRKTIKRRIKRRTRRKKHRTRRRRRRRRHR